MATEQQEQYGNLQAQLAELQDSQQGLDQEVQEAAQVRAVLSCVAACYSMQVKAGLQPQTHTAIQNWLLCLFVTCSLS